MGLIIKEKTFFYFDAYSFLQNTTGNSDDQQSDIARHDESLNIAVMHEDCIEPNHSKNIVPGPTFNWVPGFDEVLFLLNRSVVVGKEI